MSPDGVHDDFEVRPAEEEFGSAGRSSWAPVDLAPIIAGKADLEPPPLMLARADGEHLLYAGKIHWFAGEPESGKGWLALAAAMERIPLGEHVLYIDFEDEATTVVSRLLALRQEGDAVAEFFHYVRPDEPLTEANRAEIEQMLEAFQPTLGVIDGMTDALALHGIDLRDNTEVANWMRGLPMMLRDRGMAVVITDHVIKDSESRGRWSIGAQHKLAKTDVQYHLKVQEPLGRGLVGRVLIRIEKDRPGHVRGLANGKTVGELIASANGDGEMWLAIQPVDPDEDVGFRPTGYMERVSKTIEAEPGLSIRKVREAVQGGREYIDRALEVLVREEWVEVRPKGTAQCHYVLRPYRESEDPDRGGDRGGTVANRPVGEHSGDRGTVAAPIAATGHTPGDTVAAERGTTVEAPPTSDPSFSLIAGVEEPDALGESNEEGHHRLTEQEYVERWRERHRHDLERLREAVADEEERQ